MQNFSVKFKSVETKNYLFFCEIKQYGVYKFKIMAFETAAEYSKIFWFRLTLGIRLTLTRSTLTTGLPDMLPYQSGAFRRN